MKKTSIEVAGKIADALEVSLDFLIGKTSVEVESKNTQTFAGYLKA